MSPKTVLVTGGCGYIGSHICVELLSQGHRVVVVDNLSNSSQASLERVELITGEKITDFYPDDICDSIALEQIFGQHNFDLVIHLAGLKAVGESVYDPLKYYHNNVAGTVCLLKAMEEHQVTDLVFSSSCTVYGDPQQVPITEDMPRSAINPYGRSKLMIEEILEDLARIPSDEFASLSINRIPWRIIMLRYFNPVGAHPSGQIGEDPQGIPDNLMPLIMRTALNKQPHLNIYGTDYATRDGTCIRDYLHVVDLAKAHLAAMDHLPHLVQGTCRPYNLGSGRGYTVQEMVLTMRLISGQEIPTRSIARRPGDAPEVYADPTRAIQELGWQAQADLAQICRDTWRWQTANPNGYFTSSTENNN